MGDIVPGLAVLITLVGINAFFVAGEYALVRVRRTRMQALAESGNKTADIALHALDQIHRYIAGVQVGITLAGLASGRFGEPALEHMLGPLLTWLFPPSLIGPRASAAIGTALTLIIITYLLVVLSELVPKAITLQYAERVALLVARPMRAAVMLFTPLVWSMNALGSGILRLLRLPVPQGEQETYSTEELQLLVQQSHRAGVLDDIETRLMDRSFRFSDLRASDILIPRLDMVALDAALPTEELLEKAALTIHTRLPIYEGTIDNIIGILHLQDLFKRVCFSKESLDVRELLRPPLIVFAEIRMDMLLDQFRRNHTQIAIVVDEHGGTAGLVTMEDVVEEIFGEMDDALEAEQPSIRNAPDGRVLMRGETRLDEIRERLGWTLINAESDTIAGYVMHCLGRIAYLGDTIQTPYGTIRVENMARHRITQVSLIAEAKGPGE